jgi:hypothetical protein
MRSKRGGIACRKITTIPLSSRGLVFPDLPFLWRLRRRKKRSDGKVLLLTALRRYLRARKFVPKDALGQFKDTEDWRVENHVEDLYDRVDANEFEATRRLVSQIFASRRKKRYSDSQCAISIRNGQDAVTSAGFLSMSSKCHT